MIWIVLLFIAVGIGRFFIPGHALSWAGTYEAMAHIWVGVLCAILCQKDKRKIAAACLCAITVIEIILFMNR